MKLHDLHRIDEVELLTDISKTSKGWAHTKVFMGKKIDLEKLGKSVLFSGKLAGGSWVLIDTHHDHFYRSSISYKGVQFVLLAMDTAGTVQVGASLRKTGKSYAVDHLVSTDGSTIPAHKMYAAFIKTGQIITTASQSTGGLRVWMKLSSEPGIVVHGWDEQTIQPINLGAKFDDESDTHSSYMDDVLSSNKTTRKYDVTDDKRKKHEIHIAYNVILVAAKK